MEAPASFSVCGHMIKQHFQYTEILHFTVYGLYSYLHGVVTTFRHLDLTNCACVQLISYKNAHDNRYIINKLYLKYLHEHLIGKMILFMFESFQNLKLHASTWYEFPVPV